MLFRSPKSVLRKLPADVKEQFNLRSVEDFEKDHVRVSTDMEDMLIFVARSSEDSDYFLICKAFLHKMRTKEEVHLKQIQFYGYVCAVWKRFWSLFRK